MNPTVTGQSIFQFWTPSSSSRMEQKYSAQLLEKNCLCRQSFIVPVGPRGPLDFHFITTLVVYTINVRIIGVIKEWSDELGAFTKK